MELKLKGKEQVITATAFLAATHSFLSLLAEIERVLAVQGGGGLVWTVNDLNTGSAAITIEATNEASLPYDGRTVADMVIEGLEIVRREGRRPPMFTDEALRHAATLVSLSGREAGEMAIRAGSTVTIVSPELEPRLNNLLGSRVEELGTIEGSLKMITVAGNPRFNIYDSVTGLPVACRFESGLLERVASALGKRVSVTGRVSYSRDGYPKRIQDIADFLVLPDDGILPTAADVLKTGLDLTGGLLIEEFTEKRRHGRT